jgi:glycosyltransferase involved in cell wall biosynthesis
MAERAEAAPRVLGDSWYADALGEHVTPLESLITSPILRRLSSRWHVARALAVLLHGRSFDYLVMPAANPGCKLVMLVEAISKRRRMILLEFIRYRPNTWRNRLFPLYFGGFIAPCTRRSVLAAQVLTPDEPALYARWYQMPEERFHFISWPLTLNVNSAEADDPPRETTPFVLASGRAACDWPTVFSAAATKDWPLVIVCSRADLPAVERLNRDGRATVLSEIAASEHDDLLRRAAVYVLALRDIGVSAGQVRLSRAIECGTPVVATNVAGLRGYAEHGVTALVAPAGDAGTLASYVTQLFTVPGAASDLVQSARQATTERTMERYLSEIRLLIAELCRQEVNLGGTAT